MGWRQADAGATPRGACAGGFQRQLHLLFERKAEFQPTDGPAGAVPLPADVEVRLGGDVFYGGLDDPDSEIRKAIVFLLLKT